MILARGQIPAANEYEHDSVAAPFDKETEQEQFSLQVNLFSCSISVQLVNDSSARLDKSRSCEQFAGSQELCSAK